MGRGTKFSFPRPGHKNRIEKETDDTSSIPSIPSALSIPEWTPRVDNSTQPSKAERLLGTSGLAIRRPSRSQPALCSTPTPVSNPPLSPGYMTVTVSEASFGSDFTERASVTAVEEAIIPPPWQSLHPRPSSNLLGRAYNEEAGRSGSITSSISRRIHGQTSSSTLRSYYDAGKSPLAVSQQTSASAVRDMALRKGHKTVADVPAPTNYSTPNLGIKDDKESAKKQSRRNKPARLDLSKLFPRPKGQNGNAGATLLSPTKFVASPAPMSATSEYFPPHQLNHGPETKLKTNKITKAPEQPAPVATLHKKPSSEKSFQRDVFDNAKVNVRRPPRGIQHWFEGLEEEEDDDVDEVVVLKPAAVPPMDARISNLAPVRKSSLGRVWTTQVRTPKPDLSQTSHLSPATQKQHCTQSPPSRNHRPRSPSEHSVTSHITTTSSRTKESKFSSTNLQDSSVLSFSSSDEEDNVPTNKLPPVRDSLAVSTDNEGEIIIGRAQAFEVKPRRTSRNEDRKRPPSESAMSMQSISTNAATIDVMLSPDSHPSYLSIPKHSRNRRSSHTRQPSAILEDESRPRTASIGSLATVNGRPMSPSSMTASVRTAITSRSEPRSRAEQHKLMAVTEEEEALLEMMRRKRAAMAKHSFTEGYKTALKQEQLQTQKRSGTPMPTQPELPAQQTSMPRTSGFLAMDSPAGGRMMGFPTPSSSSTRSKDASLSSSDTLTTRTSRGRQRKSRDASTVVTSMLRDASSSDSNCNSAPNSQLVKSDSPASFPYRLSPTLDFSPLDPFPSPVHTPTTASIASPTTASHASPLPSPVTPGPRNGEADVDVKVAGSEPSCNGDDEMAVSSTGLVEPFITAVEKGRDHRRTSDASPRTRRRTASSGTEIVLAPEISQMQLSSQSRRESQVQQQPQPHQQQQVEYYPFDHLDTSDTPELYPSEPKSIRNCYSRRTSSIAATGRSGRTSITSSTTSPTVPTPNPRERSVRDSRVSKVGRLSRDNSLKKRESAVPSAVSARCSVSDDVLAAWGSLGGWRDFDGARGVGL
ncbi:hypothetical protein K432DRAFT_82468 [Lepidopterella palustris CBS 459.81]|uniref:Uncharacterized protein n=1 Tax=Lepidopterella palustris CBS 459.81 TaxID=1314670 RepID=A0A8E2EJF5_9PEZI|nr:hypothetical protein K432DRAFT_82468 [Lepidopterella palustris CBS 459.81]